MSQPARIARISLTSADVRAAANFYRHALGFRVVDEIRCDAEESLETMGVDSAARGLRLEIGAEIVDLIQFETPGRPYPADAASADLLFQHFALVVSDMEAAWARLSAVAGWRPISEGGPQALPPSSGGVSAFKFRDPEGRPLELLAFPADATPPHWRAGSELSLGIDHTAIVVADTARSVAFYGALGFSRSGGSLNSGETQARLDGLAAPVVEVTALTLGADPPHLELLCYREPQGFSLAGALPNDIAATRIVLARPGAAPGFLVDPDGHRVTLVPKA